MAESYSVKAILSATDRGFTSTLKNALSSVTGLAKSVGSGMLMGAGMAAFNALTSGASNLVSEINSSNVAWKTFEGNMGILGKGADEIASVKAELQKFAEQSVYSSSDMASTYAQLASVGVKSADQLVKGFGGLAAAAENPQQAMKTLSQQATQMAAKPKVQWADFKLMLEQTPAGISAVAKHMGMSADEMVTAVQKGKIKTEDFFKAIEEVGTSDSFSKLATEYKSVGQAMDGLQETIGNKLTPAFDMLSSIGIKAIEGISNKLGKIDGEAIAEKLSGWIKKAQPMWNSFQKAVSKVWAVISGVGKKLAPVFESLRSTAGSAIQGLLDKIGAIDADAIVEKVCGWAQKAQPYFDLFSSAIQTISAAVSAAIPYIMDFASAIGGFLLNNSEQICSVLKVATPIVLGLVGAFKGYKIISSLVPGMSSFAKSIASMASGGIKGLAGKLFGVAAGQTASGKAASTSSKQMLASAKAFMMIGAGVLMVAAGFALLAQSAIALSNAGGLAIGVMAGLVIAVGALMIGMMAMMKTVTTSPAKLTAMATAMIALGAAVLMIGVGFALMAQSSIALANAGGLAIGVMVGMVAVVALLAVGAAALGTALTAGAVGFVAFGAAILLVGAGALLAGVALQLVAAVLPTIAAHGLAGALAITALGGAMIVFAAGATLAGAAAIVLGAGLVVAAVGIAAAGVAVGVLGAGVMILATGALIAAASVLLLSVALPQVAAYGQQGATALTALGASLLAFAGGAAVAGAACIVLGAGLLTTGAGALVAAAGVLALAAGAIVLGAGLMICAASVTMLAGVFPAASAGAMLLTSAFAALLGMSAGLGAALLVVNAPLVLVGASALVASAGILVFGAGMLTGAAGTLAMAAALKAVQSSMKSIASSAKTAQSALKNMRSTVKVVESGLDALGSKAKSAMKKVTSAFDDTASKAKSAGKKVGEGFTQGMQSGLAKAPGVANQATALVAATLMAGRAKAYAAGAFISQGFAQGMLSCLAQVRAAAAALAAEAEKALEAKAKISSPSKVTDKLGGWFGQGWVNGITDKVKAAHKAAEKLVSIPNVATPKLAMAYGGEMSADLDYYRSSEYVIEVPLSVDGKEFARATASYTQDELNKRQTRDSRKRGKV